MEHILNRTELYGFPELDVTRDLLFGLGGMSGYFYWILWGLLVIPVLYFLITLFKRRKIWNRGLREKRSDHLFKRLLILIKYVCFHKKIIQHPFPGLIHAFIFYGFFINILALLYAFLIVPLGIKYYSIDLFYGQNFLIWALINDISAFFIIAGVLLTIYRRYFLKPSCLDNTKRDANALILLLCIFISAFVFNAIRIALNGLPEFEIWAPFSYGLAHLLEYLPIIILEISYQFFFWVHVLLLLLMGAFLATGKTGHIIFGALNILKSNLNNESAKKKFQLKLLTADEYDINKNKEDFLINDLSSKARLDLDACVKCGRCQDACPAWLVGKKLSPKKIIMQLKKAMLENPDEDKPLIGGYLTSEELWACTLCGACMEVCPMRIEHMPKIINLRHFDLKNNNEKKDYLKKIYKEILKQKAELKVITEIKEEDIQILTDDLQMESLPENKIDLEEGAVAKAIINTDKCEKITEKSLSGKSAKELPIVNNAIQSDYLNEILEIEGVQLIGEAQDFDYLYFSGCAVKNDKKVRKSALAFLKIITLAGYKVAILGDAEVCCGDFALRAGEESLFRKLAFKNIELFNKYGINKIITSCPHGYNVLKKEYRLLAKDRYNYEFKVYHYVEILNNMLKNRQISFKQDNDLVLTYHDPCFLGRYNGIYSAPRSILRSIPGAFCVEMRQNKSKSLCCGGGAVQLWIDKEKGAGFLNYRAREAYSSGAGIVVTACHRCNTMLNNGIKNLHFDNIKAVDLAEIVYNAIDR